MANQGSTEHEEDWLRALATGDGSDHLDVAHLRSALQARAARIDGEVPRADEHLYSQIRFRLRRERLVSGSFGRRHLIAVAASVMLVIGVGFALLPMLQAPEHSTIRGAANPNTIQVANPENEAEVLQEKLRTLGTKAHVRREGAAVIVEAPATLEVIEALEELKLPAQRAGSQLEVRFEKRP